jgi:hypothetical protein
MAAPRLPDPLLSSPRVTVSGDTVTIREKALLIRLDDALIDQVFQPMCDHIHARFGKTNTWLAEQFAYAACAMYLLSQAADLLAGSFTTIDAAFMAAMLYVYAQCILWCRNRASDDLSDVASTERLEQRVLRIILVIMALAFGLLDIWSGSGRSRACCSTSISCFSCSTSIREPARRRPVLGGRHQRLAATITRRYPFTSP